MKISLILILLLAAIPAFPQTANVIELSAEDSGRVKAAWEALQKAQGEWDMERAAIAKHYKVQAYDTLCLDHGTFKSCGDSAPGFENGFEFSKDFRFIVPKIAAQGNMIPDVNVKGVVQITPNCDASSGICM